MKRKKEVDLELKDIKQDVQFLKTRMETLCNWIAKKFDVVFEENSIKSVSSQVQNQNPSLSLPLVEKSKTKDDLPHEHSYCISKPTTPTSNPNPNLYDMVEDEEMENHPRTPTDDFSISPPFNGNPSILNTPKKSRRLSTKSSPQSKTKPISGSRGESNNSVPEIILNPFIPQPIQESPPPSSNIGTTEQLEDNPDHDVHIPQPAKKKRIRAKRVRIPKSQSTSSIDQNTAQDKKQSSKTPPQIIQCEICGKLINGRAAMTRHCQTHNNLRPHPCLECGKSFQRKFHLKTHMLTHNGEKKHQCRFCGKLFLLPKDIIAHERVHTGEKPYACAHCSRRFTLKSHLVMHTRTHTGEKPYKCDSCEKCFTQANSLRVHKKMHLQATIPSTATTSSNDNSDSLENVEKVGSTSAEPEPTSGVTGFTSLPMQNPDSVEYSNSNRSSGFNVIGQLIPISLSSSILSQIPSSTCTTLRIPIQLPVLVPQGSGSTKMVKVEHESMASSINNSDEGNNPLPQDSCYYDLETL